MKSRKAGVYLIGLYVVEYLGYHTRVRKIAVVQKELCIRVVRVHVNVVYPVRVECAGAADYAVDFVSFAEEEFGKV